jgi:hypothetical protein
LSTFNCEISRKRWIDFEGAQGAHVFFSRDTRVECGSENPAIEARRRMIE